MRANAIETSLSTLDSDRAPCLVFLLSRWSKVPQPGDSETRISTSNDGTHIERVDVGAQRTKAVPAFSSQELERKTTNRECLRRCRRRDGTTAPPVIVLGEEFVVIVVAAYGDTGVTLESDQHDKGVQSFLFHNRRPAEE